MNALNILKIMSVEEFCQLFNPVWTIVGYIIFFIKILVPVLLIVTGMITLVKGVISSDDDKISKAKKELVRKVVFAVSVFLVIQVVSMLIGLVSKSKSYETCATCAFSPFSNGCSIFKQETKNNIINPVPNPNPAPDVPSIIDVEKIVVLSSFEITEGDYTPINYSVEPSNASDKTVTFVTSDSSVVTVDKNGIVTGIKKGVAYITIMSSNGIFATTSIIVNSKENDEPEVVPVKKINAYSNYDLTIGDYVVINYSVEPDDATDKKVTFVSSDPSIASVDEIGKVTALKEGNVTIIIMASNKVSANVKVNVKTEKSEPQVVPVESISVISSYDLVVGDSVPINYSVEPKNATDKTVTFSSSNTSVATVNKSGIVTALKKGLTTITLTSSSGLSASCTINVKVKEEKPTKVEVKNIKVQSSYELESGDNKNISYTIEPENATNKDVIFTSSDSKVVSVDKKGKMTALKSGTSTITLTADNGVTSSITVTVKAKEDGVDPNANPIDVYFLNTQFGSYSSSEAIIMKTKDNKYVLLDTGDSDSYIVNMIYNKLKELQKSDKVVIDYLILSHLHPDHIGNAYSILNHSNINVSHFIYKDEEFNHYRITDAVNLAISKNIDMPPISGEGYTMSVGKYLSLKFYNVSDVFAGMSCNRNYLGIKFSSNISEANNFGSKKKALYVYVDGSEYENGRYIYHTTSNIITKEGGSSSGMNQYFYAKVVTDRKNCDSNGNSYGIIASVKTDKSNKYIYFANDLENVGYGIFPENGVFGSMGFTRVYGVNKGSVSDISFDSSIGQYGDFTPLSQYNHPIASESNTASRIKSDLGSKIKNIVIYQMSHHINNNAPDAIETLNLNRSSVYAIATTLHTETNSDFAITRSYYMTLKNATILRTGGSGNGVYCSIANNGSTSCNRY